MPEADQRHRTVCQGIETDSTSRRANKQRFEQISLYPLYALKLCMYIEWSTPGEKKKQATKKQSKGTRQAPKHHTIRTERWRKCACCMKLLTITIDGHLSAVQITMACPETGTKWLEPSTIEADTKGYVVTCCSLHKVLSTAQSTFKWKSWHLCMHEEEKFPQNTKGSRMM